MQEFEKVSDKRLTSEDVSKRMEEFDKVPSNFSGHAHDKTGTLPYGLKRYRPCPSCGEFMEIQEYISDGANYLCKSCGKTLQVKID